jgi:hypothetical protein
MSEEEKTITIVLGQKGENITTKQIFIMDKENTITHTPTNGGVIMIEKDGAYNKIGNIPTEFKVSKNPTADVIHKVAGKVEEIDNAVIGQTEDEKMGKAVDALTQQQTNPALIDAQLAQKQGTSDPYGTRMVSEPGPEPLLKGENLAGGYRVTKRRRNPRRKQKKSYRRRRV